MSANRSVLLLAAVTASVALMACGSDDADSSSSADATAEAVVDGTAATLPGDRDVETSVPANGDIVDVLTLDNNFRPEELEVAAGTTVRWENGGRNDHNIVPVDETQDWGVDIADFEPGDVYEHVFSTPGEYPYYCTLHGTPTAGMIGTVVVTG